MGFGNPVPGTILENKAPWPGPPQFRVTSTFAQHVASGRGAGIDIGNGRCGSPVLAMDDGTVTFVGQLSTDIGLANVVRYRVSSTEEFGAAHLATMTVVKGQLIKRGQQIGTLGMTGADACHLHQGYKVNGVEKDWWPLLDHEVEMNTTITIYPATRTWYTKGGTLTGYPLIVGNATKTGTYSAGSAAHSDAEYVLTPPPPGWPGGPMQRVIDGGMKGYLVANSAVTLDPLPTGLFTQAELDDAVDKAEVDAGKAAAGAVAASAVTEANKYR